MNHTEWNQLARRLEEATSLSNGERTALLRDVERAARQDLYGAAQLWRDHVPAAADLRMPTVLMVAEVVQRRYEGRADKDRAPVALYAERDSQVTRPETGRDYRGPVVGLTPDYAVQRAENGDYILHDRRTLTGAVAHLDREDVAIRYPFAVRGGVGLVSRVEPEADRSNHVVALGRQHEATMEHAR